MALFVDPRRCAFRGDVSKAPLQTSFVFNELANELALHVHNLQQDKWVVNHEFVDMLGHRWSLHAMVLHIGGSKDGFHLVAYILFAEKWWLCDDTRGKVDPPPPPAIPKSSGEGAARA